MCCSCNSAGGGSFAASAAASLSVSISNDLIKGATAAASCCREAAETPRVCDKACVRKARKSADVAKTSLFRVLRTSHEEPMSSASLCNAAAKSAVASLSWPCSHRMTLLVLLLWEGRLANSPLVLGYIVPETPFCLPRLLLLLGCTQPSETAPDCVMSSKFSPGLSRHASGELPPLLVGFGPLLLYVLLIFPKASPAESAGNESLEPSRSIFCEPSSLPTRRVQCSCQPVVAASRAAYKHMECSEKFICNAAGERGR